jgi:plasmid stabilization system protein ParE
MAYRLAPQAEADFEDIAFYIFLESGSVEVADRLIQSIMERFDLLDTHPCRAGAWAIYALAYAVVL